MSYGCSGCGGGYSGGACYSGAPAGYSPKQDYSALERAISEYKPSVSISHSRQETILQSPAFKPVSYSSRKYSQGLYLNNTYRPAYFEPSMFFSGETEHVSTADEEKIVGYAKQAFEATTGKEMPKDIKIRILSEKEMKKIHSENHGFWDDRIQGFCLNRKGFGPSHIFLRENRLAEMMLTLGHEIGHVYTMPLENSVDEESKAFAFSLAWMDAIAENNIAGLSAVIKPRPARNGLHDKAFGFVMDLINSGRKALEVYFEFAKRMISIESVLPDY